ncbi:MAG: FtsX-like permease family protein [Deltaproteobacteria bacterium]|nr:FtsX-like permease family protein [Deltaproteobacteria bacterium]
MKYLPFVFRNLFRNKLRTALTGGAIGLAMLLVCFFMTMPGGIDRLLSEISSNVRVSVHNKGGVVYDLPSAYVQRVRGIPGVAAVNGEVWFGGAYEDEGIVTFPSFAIDPDTVGAVWPDYGIDPLVLEKFRRQRDAVIVGRETMKKYRWRIGQQVSLVSTIWPVTLAFKIVGEIPNDRAPHFWMQREYLAQALEAQDRQLDTVGTIWVRVADPTLVHDVMTRAVAMFRNSPAEVNAETEKSFFASFFGSLQSFVQIILVVTGLVALCVLCIAANTASMAVRERSREIAVLRAIGFGRGVIFGMLVAESVVLATAAGSAGALLTYAFSAMIRTLSGSSMGGTEVGALTGFLVTREIVARGIALSAVVGLVAGIAPAWGAARRPVAETLREVF